MPATTQELVERYAINPELVPFIEDGTLVLASEDPAKHTVQFDIPGYAVHDRRRDHDMHYTLSWIHPDQNKEQCWYYDKEPGDLPHFFVLIESDSGSECEDAELNTLDDLVAYLMEAREAKD